MLYLVKTPKLIRKLFSSCTWKIATGQAVYITFDDGPNPETTAFILEQLNKYNAKATFFCVGENVKNYPELYEQLLDKGHAVGNHTFHHINGWNTKTAAYMKDIMEAGNYIYSKLFRPPYGKISLFQIKQLKRKFPELNIIMWDVLSGDFDIGISKEKCLENVLFNYEPGSIIVFHDSDKAKERMEYVLPKILTHFSQKGIQMKALDEEQL